jgi:hypothetical protein
MRGFMVDVICPSSGEVKEVVAGVCHSVWFKALKNSARKFN